jgi:hypothetical protein
MGVGRKRPASVRQLIREEIMIEFEAWPKTERLSNITITVTEKINGSNAAVIIKPITQEEYDQEQLTWKVDDFDPSSGARLVPHHWLTMVAGADDQNHFVVGAQSRKRLIWPGNDNFAFAGWVNANAKKLVDLLGPGRHFGEWWGQGIQGGHGMDRKVFSLFNQHRWSGVAEHRADWIDIASEMNMTWVPLLYSGKFNHEVIPHTLNLLRENGSFAAAAYGVNGFKAEGVVINFPYLDVRLKAFVENDELPKSLQKG